jgi:hypothetical protein
MEFLSAVFFNPKGFDMSRFITVLILRAQKSIDRHGPAILARTAPPVGRALFELQGRCRR